MNYRVILMDADDTLFDFRRAEDAAIHRLCELHRIPDADAVVPLYSRINLAQWKRLEQGEITQSELRVERFAELSCALGLPLDPDALNRDYSRALGEGAFLRDGALSLCRTLSESLPLYIVTNGILEIQTNRFNRSELRPYIREMFVSQEIGYSKPRREYFDEVLRRIGNPPREQVILLGDSLSSDMRGGRAAGITTCWYCPDGGTPTSDCDFSISHLSEFPSVIGL